VETITINVDESLASNFRKKAEQKYGKQKGYLSKAVSEALNEWISNEKDAVQKALAAIEKGIHAPQLHYKKRSELYESSHRY